MTDLSEEFEKTLSKAELDSDSALEWSNERLGQLVRSLEGQVTLLGDNDGCTEALTVAAWKMLVSLCVSTNAEIFTQTITDSKDRDWEIVCRLKSGS